MVLRLRTNFCVVMTLLLLTSCGAINHYIYRANPINLPGLTEKGESRVTAALEGNVQIDDPSGLGGEDLMGAYAISNRISLLGSYSHRVGNDGGLGDLEPSLGFGQRVHPYDSSGIHYRNDTWELGAAYTVPLSRHAFFSIAAGGGSDGFRTQDNGYFQDSAYHCFLKAQGIQWFVQPAMYFKWRRLDLGVGFRVTGTYFIKVTTNYSEEQQSIYVLNNLQGNNLMMFQPFWVLRFTPRSWLQIELQSSINAGGSTNTSIIYNYFYFNFGAGLSVNPTRIFARAKTPG